ncbi:uncharacterized protein K452DRAFT_53101 [Aplosporella prunicola CBS 121167]|uniref:Uncharacterized protein n=1 Tax=Aplosporella prunicola CBS 121167 TaxID=1176127 RepID=A0A6A6B8H2_9PEZI|nr:uncharacterized protein K452DRAFT_53101 [Aplosporella prunicola CBS 121167]KAF2140226.1 hypothetical protein K452DRAFT_53101 [Aplosporella prunicola CBS 121167]
MTNLTTATGLGDRAIIPSRSPHHHTPPPHLHCTAHASRIPPHPTPYRLTHASRLNALVVLYTLRQGPTPTLDNCNAIVQYEPRSVGVGRGWRDCDGEGSLRCALAAGRCTHHCACLPGVPVPGLGLGLRLRPGWVYLYPALPLQSGLLGVTPPIGAVVVVRVWTVGWYVELCVVAALWLGLGLWCAGVVIGSQGKVGRVGRVGKAGRDASERMRVRVRVLTYLGTYLLLGKTERGCVCVCVCVCVCLCLSTDYR